MDDPKPTLTARSPEDLLAVAPLVLGFQPEDSCVMLTSGPAGSFHARVDLPSVAEEVPVVIRTLLAPVRVHRVRSVFFILFGPDSPVVRRLAVRLASAFTRHGVRVQGVMRAADQHWSMLQLHEWGTPVAYDISGHPFLAEGVLRGKVIHESRAALAHLLDPDPTRRQVVGDWLARSPAPDPECNEGQDRAWASAVVARAVSRRAPIRPRHAARLLRALRDPRSRDAVCGLLSRESAADHVDVWIGLLRGAPDGWAAEPAAVLALAAWLSGNGALAWCAVDRARAEDPTHPLAAQVATLLEGATPPSAWDQVRAEDRTERVE